MNDKDSDVIELVEYRARSDLQKLAGYDKRFTPEEAVQALASRKKTAKKHFWQNIEPVLVDDETKLPSCKVAKLQCKQCNKLLSSSHPDRMGNEHFDSFGNCKKPAVNLSLHSNKRSSCEASDSDTKRQKTVDKFTVSPSQAAAAVEELIKALITIATPAAIENPHLKKALAHLGLNQLPGELQAPL
jgi:hypothetical protein